MPNYDTLRLEDATDQAWFTADFTDDLTTGETVSSAAWTIDAALTSLNTSTTTTSASIKLTGGVSGNKYEVSVQVTTSLPQKLTHRFFIYVP